jgi:hypothetical protein
MCKQSGQWGRASIFFEFACCQDWTPLKSNAKESTLCPSGGMVDAGDSKSPALTGVPVRVRPWVPTYAVSFREFSIKTSKQGS